MRDGPTTRTASARTTTRAQRTTTAAAARTVFLLGCDDKLLWALGAQRDVAELCSVRPLQQKQSARQPINTRKRKQNMQAGRQAGRSEGRAHIRIHTLTTQITTTQHQVPVWLFWFGCALTLFVSSKVFGLRVAIESRPMQKRRLYLQQHEGQNV